MEVNLWVQLRRSPFALPLAAMVALAVVVINETGYGEATDTVVGLGGRASTRIDLQEIQRGILEAESGQRGYLLTGRQSYLEPYNRSVEKIDSRLRSLINHYVDDPASTVLARRLEERVREKLSELATTLNLYAEGKQDQWRELLMSDIGREKMEEVRRDVQALLVAETNIIASERENLFRTLRYSRIGVNVMAAVALLALFLFLRKKQALDHALADHALALQADHDKLEQEVVRRTADLTELAQHLETAREDERGRLARELHDELGALLTAAKLDAARLKRSLGQMPVEVEDKLKRLNSTVDQGIALKRRIIEELRPSLLSHLGLAPALEIQAKEFAQRSDIPVRAQLEPVELSDNAEISIYRLVQESLTNIAKYAYASDIAITLERVGERVHIAVQDNGRGFDPKVSRHSAHGLMGMRYRVEAQGGVLRVTSAPGQGTTVDAWLPADPPATTAPSPSVTTRDAA